VNAWGEDLAIAFERNGAASELRGTVYGYDHALEQFMAAAGVWRRRAVRTTGAEREHALTSAAEAYRRAAGILDRLADIHGREAGAEGSCPAGRGDRAGASSKQ
jgi:hypothetical protein